MSLEKVGSEPTIDFEGTIVKIPGTWESQSLIQGIAGLSTTRDKDNNDDVSGSMTWDFTNTHHEADILLME